MGILAVGLPACRRCLRYCAYTALSSYSGYRERTVNSLFDTSSIDRTARGEEFEFFALRKDYGKGDRLLMHAGQRGLARRHAICVVSQQGGPHDKPAPSEAPSPTND